MDQEGHAQTRRNVLKATGAAGVAGITGLAGCSGGGGSSAKHPAIGNYPVEGDTVTFGFNVPLSGSYSQEGKDELRGYKLAKKHLNSGGGWVDMWEDLKGNGILGKKVEHVEGDTATSPETARQAASRMIKRDNAIMITGGSSSSVAIAVQELCQREKVQFMACVTHSNATTGSACVRYSFREVFNAYMTGQALAPILKSEWGSDLNFYTLYADYTWGASVMRSMKKFLSEAGWNQVKAVPTPLGTSDYSSYLSDVPRDKTDVLILAHYGLDAANSLPQAVKQGMREDMKIVVPFYNRLMLEAARDYIGGVYGTVDWNWQLGDDFSKAFTEAFRSEYEKPPSYAARLAYTQTLQYAAAVERAETFYPPKVIKELEAYEYDNAGLGPELMRKCDHQAQRDVLVTQGLSKSAQTNDKLLNIVEQTPKDQIGYACDVGPAAQCDLGPYGGE